ncbi:uncharacterized protein PHACADRAFT_251345 [Phanerochaete carnosa HHB-10118-sp]|uniref:Uncharacterized protein n=1 Tax=Phanerochaete carnosa (strain HHB-10118-sp) TaxID=650164 RepID=K5WEW6_PHACS|nr:uncharacterized protein PHACADRAFT_251345 [Phanerochaete carnosa HHB-10118-sp]EKM57624.1 hypothetical protein PHACADRAFT_251345 [Phanerochaete carnosa HHB-10118-sp]
MDNLPTLTIRVRMSFLLVSTDVTSSRAASRSGLMRSVCPETPTTTQWCPERLALHLALSTVYTALFVDNNNIATASGESSARLSLE